MSNTLKIEGKETVSLDWLINALIQIRAEIKHRNSTQKHIPVVFERSVALDFDVITKIGANQLEEPNDKRYSVVIRGD